MSELPKMMNEAPLPQSEILNEREYESAKRLTIKRFNDIIFAPGDGNSWTLDSELMPNGGWVDIRSNGTPGRSWRSASPWLDAAPTLDEEGQVDGGKHQIALITIVDLKTTTIEQDGFSIPVSFTQSAKPLFDDPVPVVYTRIIDAEGNEVEGRKGELLRLVNERALLGGQPIPHSRGHWEIVNTTLQTLEEYKNEIIMNRQEQDLPEELRREALLGAAAGYSDLLQDASTSFGTTNWDDTIAKLRESNPELVHDYAAWTKAVLEEAGKTGEISIVIQTNLTILMSQVMAGFNDETFIENSLQTLNKQRELLGQLKGGDNGIGELIENIETLLHDAAGDV